MRYRTLGSGDPTVSELGFGASPLGGIYGTFAEQDGIAAVHASLDAGINFLDVAAEAIPALRALQEAGLSAGSG